MLTLYPIIHWRMQLSSTGTDNSEQLGISLGTLCNINTTDSSIKETNMVSDAFIKCLCMFFHPVQYCHVFSWFQSAGFLSLSGLLLRSLVWEAEVLGLVLVCYWNTSSSKPETRASIHTLHLMYISFKH